MEDGDEATEEDDEDDLPGHQQETQPGQCLSAGHCRLGSAIYSSIIQPATLFFSSTLDLGSNQTYVNMVFRGGGRVQLIGMTKWSHHDGLGRVSIGNQGQHKSQIEFE